MMEEEDEERGVEGGRMMDGVRAFGMVVVFGSNREIGSVDAGSMHFYMLYILETIRQSLRIIDYHSK